MSPAPPVRHGEGGTLPLKRIDRELVERSIRFTLTVMAPIVLTHFVGIESWLVFAMVAAIVSFAGDAGGPPLPRLGWMAAGPAALSLGLLLGSASLSEPGFVTVLSMLAGLAYGLVEAGHPHLLLAARFFAFGIALAGLVAAPHPVDYLAIAAMLVFAWLVSLAFDLPRRPWRQLSVSAVDTLLPGIRGLSSDRWAFGIAVALTIGGALAATDWTAASRPSWAVLTILMVMRSEVASSLQLAAERVVGTLGGVLVAALVAHWSSHRMMLAVMALAAFVRWPAQQVNNALGVFCLTIFVLLLIELVTPDGRAAQLLLQERFFDTVIGAVAAGIGLLAFRLIRPSVARMSGAMHKKQE